MDACRKTETMWEQHRHREEDSLFCLIPFAQAEEGAELLKRWKEGSMEPGWLVDRFIMSRQTKITPTGRVTAALAGSEPDGSR